MGNLMEEIAPVLWNGFAMGQEENDQMISTDIRLVQEISRLIIVEIRGEKSTFA